MAQCIITNCTDLINCLNTAVTGPAGSESIELSAGLFGAAGELANYLLLPSLTVSQNGSAPLIVPEAPCVWIKGKAVLFPGGPAPNIEYALEISAALSGTTVVLVLKATPLASPGWSFAANFPPFPDYYGFKKSGLHWLPSFYSGIVITAPAFWIATAVQADHPRGLSFTGFVDLTQGSLEPVGSYLPGSSKIPLHGPMTLRTGTYPLLQWTGDLTNYSIQNLAELSLQFGVKDKGKDKDPTPAESVLLLAGSTKIGNFPQINLSAPILQGNFVWVITGEIANKEQYPLSSILPALAGYAGGYNLPLPSGMGTNGFYLDSVTVSIVPGVSPTIDMIGFRIASGTNQQWTAPLLGLTISDLATEWLVMSPFSDPQLIGGVSGTLRLGTGDDAPRLLMAVDLSGINAQTAPNVAITAELDPNVPVPLAAVFKQFTGIDIDLNLTLSRMMFKAETGTRTLQFSATLEGTWPFPIPLITFGETNFLFLYTPNSITGSVNCKVSIATFEFIVSADYAGKGKGWQFAGQLAPDSQGKNLQDFVNSVTNNKYPNLPGNLGTIELQKFAVSFNTQSRTFSFDAALVWPFKFDNFFDLTLGAELSITSPGPTPPSNPRQYAGFVSGTLSVNAFSVSVVYNFDLENNKTLTFLVKYQSISLTCVFSKNDKGERILKANLGGVTFGGILEYLVNLVDPNLGFRLSPPWDVLNEIDFSNLTLTVNLTTKDVGFSYKLGKNFGIAEIDTLGLSYVSKAGRKTVDIIVTGKFFDLEYPDTNPLSWDLLNDPPPTPPGKGAKLLDLKYLGIGQNVGFRETRNFKNVQDVIKDMSSDFLPVDAQDQNPLTSPILDKLKFTGDGRWLIGADFTIMGAVSLTVVFNDPSLYGLRIALSGEKAKSFAGLDFQILYKKVTDTIGVYHIELTVPDAFRQLQFGAVAVTLPIITIDIYTNGNFRLDFGFPVGIDFSRSFCVQAGPFIGFGGFYFALLDGATSSSVPKITNGTFSPVIEAGLALSVGLGRTVDKGVLTAGVSITVQAILQGVFGWFNPNDSSASPALYYWIQGSAAIVGKLYGTVNFFVVQAEVHVTAYASVTLTVEAYKAIQVELVIGVEVSVSIKILFIRVSFSFSMKLDFSFTIGSASTTPWIVDASQPAALILRQQIDFLGRSRLSGAKLQRILLGDAASSGTFDWTPRAVFPSFQQVALTLVPSLTVAAPAEVFATRHLSEGPQLQIVAALFAPNSVPVEAQRAHEVRAVTDPSASQTPFNLLVTGMLKWAISSYTRAPEVQDALQINRLSTFVLASDVDAIADYLADPNRWTTIFTYDAVAAMMELNYKLRITTPFGPTGMVHPNGQMFASVADAPEVPATVFPMIPDLQMTPAGGKSIDFWNYSCITPDYEQALTDYYRQLQVKSGTGPAGRTEPAGFARTHFRNQPGPTGCTGSESLATFIFRDYFAMATKGAVNAAKDLLKAYPYEPTGSESLESIADNFSGLTFEYRTKHGDTIGKIAGLFGVAPRSVKRNNVHLASFNHRDALPLGTLVSIDTRVTPAAIAHANPGYPLHSATGNEIPVTMTISGVNHQVMMGPSGQSESLGSICDNFGVSGPASVFTFVNDTVPPSNPNTGNTNLLQPGAQMTMPARTFQVISPIDDIPALVAAFFFVRSIGPAQPGQEPWYSNQQFFEQWILDNNADLRQPVWNVPTVIKQPDGSLIVSTTGPTAQYAVQGGTESQPMLKDTPALVAGYFAMTELAPAPYTEAFQQFQGNVSPSGPPLTYAISNFSYIVAPGDTMATVAHNFGLGVDAIANANASVFGLFQEHAVLGLPLIEHTIQPGDTLGSVASNFDLTLDALADSVEKNAGILQPFHEESPALTIPDVPGRPEQQLLDDLVTFGRYNDIAGTLTRFLLHGMRVPKPGSENGKVFPPNTPLWGLYEMAGQQFPWLSEPVGPVDALDIVFAKGGTADWICFDSGVKPTESTEPPCDDKLVVHLRSEFFADPPALTLDPEILAGPGPLPLYRDTPPQYSMQQSIHWQTASPIPLPGPSGQAPPSGQPSLWIFPSTLLNIALDGPPGPTGGVPYDLMVASQSDRTGSSDVPVSFYCWAAAIDVRIQRAPTASGTGFMPNSYVLAGADQDGRDQLLAAWTYFESMPAPYGQLYILYSPSATSDNSKGLVSDALDLSQTFLIKSNLTTVTQSNQSALLAAGFLPASGDYYARFDAIPDFLRLAWEASITGSGGFYLNYATGSGNGLPESVFANSAEATVTLVLLTERQDTQFGTDRGLYPFNNCAVVGDNFDPSVTRLYARLESPTASDLIRVATVPAGNAGFYLARVNPDPGGTAIAPTGPADQTRNLYNLAGFRIAGNSYFSESNQGLPAGPADTPVEGAAGPTGSGVWWYQQVLPVYKFGKVNNAPGSSALPSVAENPYAGITGAIDAGGPLSQVTIDVAFHDVYGNRTISSAPAEPVIAPVGYTDEIIGISSWPGTGADFQFGPTGANGVLLDTALTQQIVKYVPSGAYGFDQAHEAAVADASRYAQIFYQVQQRDLAFQLQANLGTVSLAPDSLKAPMTAFVTKSKLFTDAAASLQQRTYTTQSGDQLATIAKTYDIEVGALVQENASQQVAPLFQGKIVQPLLAIAGPMNTLDLLIANQISTAFPPACGTAIPAPPDCPDGPQAHGSIRLATPGSSKLVTESGPIDLLDLSTAELLSNNQASALTPGIVLRTALRTSPLPSGMKTMADVASALQCVVYGEAADPGVGPVIPIGLFVDNLTAANVVAPNIDIEIDGVKQDTGPNPTFQSVQTSFASLGLDTPDFVIKLQKIPGIFAPAAQIAHADFIVPQPPASSTGTSVPVFSIANMPAGTGTISELATLNSAVPNFFNAGTPVYLSYCCYTPQRFDTFASLAQQFKNLTLNQLAQFNSSAPLQQGVALKIPNLTFLGNPGAAYSPYSPTSSDSLSSIATLFGTSAPIIAALNRNMPGIFADGANITIGTTIPAAPLDSLQSMADKFQLSFDDFITKLTPAAEIYRTNGVVIAPLPTVPAGLSMADLAKAFNVQPQTGTAPSPVPILQANRCLEQFLRDGASIAGPAGTFPVKVGPHDTIDTVIRNFSENQKVQATIEQIAEANGSTPNLLTGGRAFVLPPSPTAVQSLIVPQIPPSGTGCESSIVFPVSVGVTMTRAHGLVAPDFTNTRAVFTNATAFSARGWDKDASSLNLATFATAFESAFGAFRLKCALSKRDALSDPKQAGQLFAVNFGPSGVSQFTVDSATPQFYALAPLSTQLQSGTIPVRTYESGSGLCPPVMKTFDSVDLDSWMLQFLSTVDLFLSTPYSVPAFQLIPGAKGFASEFDAISFTPSGMTGPVGLGGMFVPRELSGPAGPMGGTCSGGTGAFGPGNFDDIVNSKLVIAEQLTGDVVPILNGAGATSGYYSDTAQDTLYQQMLVKVSDAYGVNAIVQYPVGIQSPCVTPFGPTGTIPPRVSGKIVPDLYVTPKGTGTDTLNAVADYFGVSAPFAGETIGDIEGILRAGAIVTHLTPPGYKIESRDTLNNVAAHFGLDTDPNQPGYWEVWTAFIQAIADQSVFVLGGSFPVVKIARNVHAGDTLGSIADYFAVDPGTLGKANQGLKGIFQVNQPINITGYQPYTVKAQDTLSLIAAAIQPIGGGTQPLTVSVLAQSVADQLNLLSPNETLFLTQTLPDVTMSTAKVTLGPIGDAKGPDPALSFLFSLKHPKQFKNLFLNLKYVINEMEYGIANVPGATGYQSSSWLSFLLPIGSGQGSDVGVQTSMGQVQIPIPLRSYPVPPTVTAQSGLPTQQAKPPQNPAQAIDEGKQWDYRLDFQSLNAPQDTDHVQAVFNTPPANGFGAFGLSRTDLVFRALAEFIDAYPRLITDLAILTKLSRGQFDNTAAVAVQVLDTFAASVAQALSGSSMAGDVFGLQWPELKYLYKLQSSAASGELKELRLGMELGPSGAAPLFPDVFIKSPTAPTGGTGPDAGFLPLVLRSATGMTADFEYPAGFAINTSITQRFLFKARDVIENQNASGGIYVTRNDDLIASGPLGAAGVLGPTGTFSTNEAFVYQTPLISFIDPLTPFVVDKSAIDISGLTGPSGPAAPPRTLGEHIENMLDAVLDVGPQSLIAAESYISILCSYGFALSGGGTPGELVARTPIRLVPTQLLNPAGKTAFANQLAASIQNWPGWPGNNNTGVFIMDLSVFTVSPGMTGSEFGLKPILEFENLRVPISQIGDIPGERESRKG